MSWRALVPIKPPGARKTRLGAIADREAIVERMLDHVLAMLGCCPAIGSVHLLTAARRIGVEWIQDRGRGLNAELTAARTLLGPAPLLVLLPDLPRVGEQDITLLLAAAAQAGCALAPDRHGSGTNAVALHDGRPFAFAFGTGSFAAHRLAAGGACGIVESLGLALDVDTPDDLARARGA